MIHMSIQGKLIADNKHIQASKVTDQDKQDTRATQYNQAGVYQRSLQIQYIQLIEQNIYGKPQPEIESFAKIRK